MKSIKDKIADMITLANGELVRHCHAKAAGILIEEPGMITRYKTKKRRQDKKQKNNG